MSSLLPGQSPVGLMGRQLLLDRLEQGFIDNRRLLPRQKLTPVFDLADEEPVAEQVGEGAAAKGNAPASFARAEGLGLCADAPRLEVRTNLAGAPDNVIRAPQY